MTTDYEESYVTGIAKALKKTRIGKSLICLAIQ
jgi:hypothetical protein